MGKGVGVDKKRFYEDHNVAEITQDIHTNNCLFIYTNKDIEGVELCGTINNIIVLVVGIATGIGYGLF